MIASKTPISCLVRIFPTEYNSGSNCLQQLEEEEEDDDDEQSAFLQFSENHRSCVFYGV